ncbi:MAG: hypothetical protein K9N23_00725 [Akkermansiaceae bacterium]|nr:hypothetical protein [Akkermansiaceae bacterium]
MKRWLNIHITATAISLLLTALPCAAADFFLKNGNRIAMMGDSITEQHLSSSYVEVWALPRFPAWDLKLKKNSYFHDRIFCGRLRAGGIPEFMEMPPEQVESKRLAAFRKRMETIPELVAAIRKALVMQAHQVEIVGTK